MKTAKTYSVAIGCILSFFCYSLAAQHPGTSPVKSPGDDETTRRMENYRELKNLGYTDRAIFEDLGNASFLAENYESAIYWYSKLKDEHKGALNNGYQKRYQYAQDRMSPHHVPSIADNKDWVASVRLDYQINRDPLAAIADDAADERFMALDFHQKDVRFIEDQVLAENNAEALKAMGPAGTNLYDSPIALTADGNTAYFSKAVYVKPLYGIFSRKELVHKIYKAEKINGEWTHIGQVALCPKNYSTIHPSISEDGKRLFFASDMPGTFGKFDIYVADIHNNGTFGDAKNLGEKVNTRENDLYPKITDGSTLFFASEGHEGFGGLDIFMAQVAQNKVKGAVNLGSPINSVEDDFSIYLVSGKGMGYVMSNRGSGNDAVHRVAFSYSNPRSTPADNPWKYNMSEIINDDLKIDYSNSVFEDD